MFKLAVFLSAVLGKWKPELRETSLAGSSSDECGSGPEMGAGRRGVA